VSYWGKLAMRKTFFIVWSVILLVLISTTVYAEAPQQGGGLVTTVITRSNLRAGPGTEWRLMGTVEVGTTMALDGRDPSAWWVRGITSSGQIGWVGATFLAITPEQAFSLPSIWVDTPFTLGAPGAGAPASAPQAEAPSADTSTTTTTVTVPGTGGILVSVGSNVNVRSGPGTNSPRVTTLSAGVQVRADSRDTSGTWVHATVPDGTAGWIFASYLIISPSDLAGLPVAGSNAVVSAPSAPQTDAQAPQSAPPPAPVVNTAPVHGFNLGGQVSGFSDTAANWMRQAGMTWVKRQWRYTAGQNAGDVGGIIGDAHARGFRILVSVVGHPSDVNNGGYFEQFASFVGGVAGLGADAIEVWNEQNIDREWPGGSIDPGRYTQLLALSYNAIKGTNPNTMVISGAPAPTGFFNGCGGGGCDDAPYLRGMAAAGAASYMDCVGIHYNEGIVPPSQTSGDPRGSSGHYTRYFWGMINTYAGSLGGRPLCFTELGYLTPEGLGPLPGAFAWAGNVTVSQQAQWLDQAVSLAAGSGRVNMVIVWNVDFSGWGSDPHAGYAIMRPDGSCPACAALGS
jgi:uncharacterized protein YraI